MSKTSVASDLLHSLEIVSELGVQTVGDELSPVAVSDVSLSVEEPLGDVVVYNRRVRYSQSLRISSAKSSMQYLPVGLARISLTFSISCSVSSPALIKHGS